MWTASVDLAGKYERASMKRSLVSPTEPSRPKQAHSSPQAAAVVHQCLEPECGRQFNRKYTLVEHMKTHTGEKPHVCPVRTCNKRFSTSGNLSRHKRLHGFIQPIECPVEGCRSAFVSDNKLEKHMKFHMGGAVQVCGVGSCGKTFSTMGNLNRHLKNHHPETIRGQRTNGDDEEEESSGEEDDSEASEDTCGAQLKPHAVPAAPRQSTRRTLDQLDVLASILHEEIDFIPSSIPVALAVANEEEESEPETPRRKRRRTILEDMISFHVAHFGE